MTMGRFISRAIRRITGDRAGTAIVETAIIMPVLIMLSLGFIDLTRAVVFKLGLKQDVQTGAAFVLANYPNTPSDSQIQTQISNASGLPASQITITRWTDCNSVSEPTIQSCPNSTDYRADFMRIRIVGTFTPILNIADYASFMPQRDLSSEVVVRIA